MTYNFPQFNLDLTNPTVTADVNTIGMQPDAMTISVSITLETANAKLYGLHLEDISVIDTEYTNYDNLMLRVTARLNDFII